MPLLSPDFARAPRGELTIPNGYALPSPAQWALELIDRASRRRKELDSGTEVRSLPGGFDDAEDAETEGADNLEV